MKGVLKVFRVRVFAAVFFIAFGLMTAGFTAAGEEISAEEYEALREQALERPRRIIFNSDGGDTVRGGYGSHRSRREKPGPGDDAETLAEKLVNVWMSPLKGSQVDSVFFCSTRGTFGQFSHNTQVGEISTDDRVRGDYNYTRYLIGQGSCPLQVMVDFARENGMEIFLSKRMNDTHDSDRPLHGPQSTASRFKRENPQYLLGEERKHPAHGSWSSVNYAVPEVRELVFRVLEEACRNFELDGIELDFFRHPVFFEHEPGEPVGKEELDMMTGLIRRIREMTEEVGRKDGRPILVAVRVPDCVEYSRAIGLDLEKWLEEDLIDIMVVSGYWRMNPWRYSADLGHRYGVKVYAGLSDSRVGGRIHAHPGRASDEAYRARAMSAWASGMDGIYTFNLFHTWRPIFRQMGDPEAMEGLDKIYYLSVRGAIARARGAFPYNEYINIPFVTPDTPLVIADGKKERFELVVGDDTASAAERGLTPFVTLNIRGNGVINAEEIEVVLNGNILAAEEGENSDGIFVYGVRPDILEKGVNVIEVLPRPGSAGLYMKDVFLELKY